jgi:hypothetical protein
MSIEASNDKRKDEFTIVVMSKDVEFTIQEHTKLAIPSEEALKETGNNPDLSKWTLKNGNGKELSFEETEKDAGIKKGDVLYLSPKTSAGGS